MRSEVEALFPYRAVQQLAVVRDESQLLPLVRRYRKMRCRLEALLDFYDARLYRGKPVKRKQVCLCLCKTSSMQVSV